MGEQCKMSGNYGSEANGERSCYVTTGTGVSAAERCPEVERGGIPCGGILIREATPEDAPRLLEIYAYYVERTAITFEYDVPSVKEFRDRILHTKEKYPYLIIEEDGVIRGYAYAGVFKGRAAYDRSCEVSIYLDRDSRGRGYGRALYDALEKQLRAQGILNLYACIASPIKEDERLTNNSGHFHAHLGFKRVGEFHRCAYKFGRWYNMIWMGKFVGEHS